MSPRSAKRERKAALRPKAGEIPTPAPAPPVQETEAGHPERFSEAERSLADGLPQIVWTASGDGQHLSFSRRWADDTGLGPQEGAGQGWLFAVHPEDRQRCREIWEHAVLSGEGFETECRLRHASGGYRWHLARGASVTGADGRAVRWFGTFTDIDDLKRRQGDPQLLAEAQSANRAKDEFLAMISHELRTPLGAILIWSQLLRNEKLDEAATGRALGMIERSTRMLAKLIDDLLDVSRITEGKLRLDTHPMLLGPLVEAAVEAAQPDAAAKGLTLTKVLPEGAGAVSGDPVRLQQVVGNLLSNAIKFTPEGGRVEVRLETLPSEGRIMVTDSGVGIRPEFLPYIFERFRQADSTTTRPNKGLGLGLAISRHLVELHGGGLQAASPGENQGSTFVVTLPLSKAVGVVPAADAVGQEPWPAEGARLRGVRILVVDDEDDARDALALVLERCGARVRSAASAAQAWVELQRESPDVLLSDVAMPGEDGYSLMRKVQALLPGPPLPAVAVTAYATAEDRERAFRAGYRAHLCKPVDPAVLVALVERLAGRPELRTPSPPGR